MWLLPRVLGVILFLIFMCALLQDNIVWIVPNDPWMQNRDKLQVRNIDCDPLMLPGEINISQLQGKIEFNTFFF